LEILVVNPNTTRSMTEKIGRAAERAAAPGTRIRATQPEMGPASIEGFYDEAFSVPGLLAEIARGEADGVAAHIVACFDDTGLDAARSLASAPVIGIGEAAFHMASLVAHRFTVVTTAVALDRGHRGQPRPLRAGHALCRGARGRGAGAGAGGSRRRRRRPHRRRDRARQAETAPTRWCWAACRHGRPRPGTVGRPRPAGRRRVAAAVAGRGLARLGLRTAKSGPYAPPLPKSYTGIFAPWAPR
jgi:allantoin racemase